MESPPGDDGDEEAVWWTEMAAGRQLALGRAAAGRAVLEDLSDPFLEELSEVQLVARCGSSEMAHYIDWCAANVLEWPLLLPAFFRPALLQLAHLLQPFALWTQGLPPRITLFLTTGREEARTEVAVAYCRSSHAIFISRANFSDWEEDPSKLHHLLLHELWHIWSRNASPDQCDDIYRLFGFKRVPKKRGAPYPEELAALRFTNPDAKYLSHYIDVRTGGEDQEGDQVLPFCPLTFLAPYDFGDETLSPMDHMTVGWGVLSIDLDESSGKADVSWVTEPIQPEDGQEVTASVEGDGEGPQEVTLIVPTQALPEDFWRQVSRNTGYVFHVEEIAAENFVALVLKSPCDCPQLLEKMGRVLSGEVVED